MIWIVILAIVLGMLFGFWRGFKKSVVRLISVVLAAVLAFILALVVSNSLISSDIVADLIGNSADFYGELESVSPTLIELIRAVPVALITPLLFLIIYALLKALLWIPYKILCKVLKFNNKDQEYYSEESEASVSDENEEESENTDNKPKLSPKMKNRLLGIPLGAAQALVSVLVVLFVLGGYLYIVDKVMDSTMEIEDAKENEDLEMVNDVLDSITSDPAISMFCSGKSNNFVFEELTKIKIDGEKCSLTQETVTMLDAFIGLTPLMESEGTTTISEEQIELLENFVSDFGDSVILKTVSSEVVSNCSLKWSEGEEALGVSFSNVNSNLKPIVEKLFEIMGTTDKDTIEKDLDVMIQLLNIFSEHGMLENSEYNVDNFMNTLNSSFATEVIELLSNNKRFKSLIPEIENLSISILSSALKLPEVSEEQYDEVTQSIADAMNQVREHNDPEAVKQLITDEIHNAVNEGGVEIGEDVANVAADAITKAFEEHQGEFTKETIQDYFDKYSLDN